MIGRISYIPTCILLVGLLLISACTESSTGNNTINPNGSSNNIPSNAIEGGSSSTTNEVSVYLGSHLDEFQKKYGKYTSKYMDSYGFENGLDINTEDKSAKEITLRYAGETFLNSDEALEKIKHFLPTDANKISESSDGQILLIAYTSLSMAQKFEGLYSQEVDSLKGVS